MTTSTLATATGMAAAARALDSVDVDALPIRATITGQRCRVLWHTNECVAGVVDLIANERLERHVHADAEHHVWVARGTCQSCGRCLDPGSYVHVPAGVEHDLEGGPRGCRLFFVFHRPAGGR